MTGVQIVTVALVLDGADADLHIVTDLPNDEAAALLIQAADLVVEHIKAHEAERRRS